MRRQKLRFCFVQIMSLATLILFLSLGSWQLDRGQVKSVIEQATQPNDEAAVELRMPLTEPSEWRYRKVKLTGVYDSEQQFLLDNQVRDGVAGYNVLTPMHVEKQAAWVLVDRGWIAQSSRRDVLPSIVMSTNVSNSPVLIQASVYVPYAQTYTLGGLADGEDAGWPRRIQYVDYSQLSERLGITLQPFTLRLSANENHGYRRDWAEHNLTASKHYGYAFQWFAMALAIVVLWWIYSIKPLLKKS